MAPWPGRRNREEVGEERNKNGGGGGLRPSGEARPGALVRKSFFSLFLCFYLFYLLNGFSKKWQLPQ